MKFEELLREFNIPTSQEKTGKKTLLKAQLKINESYLAACDDVSRKQGLGKMVKELNSLIGEEMMQESTLITDDKRELLDLIDDLLDMINNPSLKLTREQLINKLEGYRQQLNVLEQ